MKYLFNQHFLVFLTLSILVTNNICGQTRLETVELNTQRSIRKLRKEIINRDKNDTILVNNLSRLSESATILFTKISNDESLGQPSDTLFVNSLEQSQQAINQLVNEWKSNEYAANSLKSIKIDYDIKAASSPLGATSKVITNIEVSVVTKSGNKDVPGYDVKYNCMWDSDMMTSKNTFNNQTNNAVKILSPGYYIFWIEKEGILIQKKLNVEIGNLMRPNETIIFNL